MRSPWESVIPPVQRVVADVCGSPVVAAVTQRGGFSPGVAARVVCASGARFFVKLVEDAVNAHSAALHRAEGQVLQALRPLAGLPAPRLVAPVVAHGWTGLVVEDVDGRSPQLPWRDDELDQVLQAVAAAGALRAPVALPDAADGLQDQLDGWRRLGSGPVDPRLDPWCAARLPELRDLEAGWPAAAAGDRLVHGDLRADNVLLTAHGARVVDWPAACRADPLLDLVLLAPSVTMQGGPAPDELLRRAGVQPDDRLPPLVCAFAGFLVQRSLEPDPPGLPTLRAFQAAQGVQAVRWLQDLL